jgi:MFS family permease
MTVRSAALGRGQGARPPLCETFRALHNPNYRLFWFGQLVSLIGTWMQSTALAWLVLKISNSPLALGTMTTIQFTPVLIFVLFGGVIADRLPKQRLLIATQSTMMLQALALAIPTSTHLITLPLIYLLAGVQGCANALDNPARQALVAELVGPEDLPNAVALNSTLFNTSRLIGPALGGVAIATIGIADCFYLNAASFLAVIGSLLLMRPERFFLAERPPRGKVLKQVGEGLRYAVTTPDIALIVLLMAVLGTFGYNFTVFLPLIAKYTLHMNAIGYGVLTSSVAVGSLAAALAIAYSGGATRRTLLTGSAGFSVLLLGVALSGWWQVTIPLLVALGTFSIVFTTTANSRLQLITPPQLRGRVMSIYTLLFLGSTPIGSLIVGSLADRQGVQPAVAEMALICLLGVAAALLYVRRTRERLVGEGSRGSAIGSRGSTVAREPSEPIAAPVTLVQRNGSAHAEEEEPHTTERDTTRATRV